jgi:PAS domain S-box-containing protein
VPTKRTKPGYTLPLLLVFALLALGLILSGYWYYEAERKAGLKQVEASLSAIARLKVDQIQTWRAERMSDARFIFSNREIARDLSGFYYVPSDSLSRGNAWEWMTSMYKNQHYAAITAIDTGGKSVAHVGETQVPLDTTLRAAIREAASSRSITFADIGGLGDNRPFLDLVVPLFLRIGAASRWTGSVILRIDPAHFLYPVLDAWPLPARTSATILCRVEGDSVVFVNDPERTIISTPGRHVFRRSFWVPVINSVLTEGTTSGIDPRGVRVISFTGKVSGSPWFLIVKIDASEAFAPSTERGLLVSALVLVLILATLSFVVMQWRNKEIENLRALRASEDRFRLAVEGAPLPVMIHAVDGEILTVNDAWLASTGYRHSDVPTVDAWIRLAYGVDDRQVRQRVKELFSSESASGTDEREIRIANGEKRDWVFNSAPLGKLGDGRKTLITMALDVTDRRQAEEALAASNARLNTIIQASPLPIFTMDLEGDIRDIWNTAAEQLLGWTIKELEGKVVPVVIGADPVEFVRMRDRLVAQGGFSGYETVRKRKDGSTLPASISASGVRDASGTIREILVILEDVSARKRAESEIRQLNEELEQRVAIRTRQLEYANKELEAFSYSVSHDLRAPLRAIDGFSRILETGYADKVDEEGRKFLGLVRSSVAKMGVLIDDLLDFARTARTEILPVEIDMNALVGSVIGELVEGGNPEESGLRVSALPPAFGDPSMIRQVWVNILSNALKFSKDSHPRRIEVGTTVSEGAMTYFVRDNGVGFDMEYAPKLFGVFQRLHPAAAFEGTGVGLAIVQRIIHRHGGRIRAEGEVGRGATFYFTLPGKDESP